jgi:predicted metal-dependent peptidase
MPLTVEASPEAAARSAVDKIAAARVWLLKEKPFFGVLARALLVEPDSVLPTVLRLRADDRLDVNPRAVLAVPFPNLCARLAHVAMHAALGAQARRAHRTEARWNFAHDLAVEPLVRAAALPAGLGELPDWLRNGMSAEEVYELLPEDASPLPEWCDLCDAPRSIEERAPPPGAPRGTNAERDVGNDPSEAGDALEAEGGRAEARDLQPAAHEIRARELAWKMRLAEALMTERASGGKTWGAVPAWIDAMVSAVIQPAPNWTVLLQRSVAALARTERTFLRPSRRQSAIAFDAGELWPTLVSMPGRKVVHAGILVAIVDTSASMSDEQIARALGAICAAATAEGLDEVRLIQADATVTSDAIVSPADLLMCKIAVKGRGGTAFGPALLALAKEAERDATRFTAVYITDLDGTFPEKRAVSAIEVLWVTPVRRPVPFGRVLRMA